MGEKREFIILLVGRLGSAALALASMRAMTYFLQQDQMGLYYVVLSLISYFSLVLINPLGMFLNRHIHQWHKNNQLGSVFKSINIYFISIGVLAIVVGLVVQNLLGVAIAFSPMELAIILFTNIYFGTWFQTLCPFLNMLQHRSAFVKINLASQILGLFLSYIFLQFNLSTFSWMIGAVIGQGIGAVLSWLYFKLNILNRPSVERSVVFLNTSTLHFVLPLTATTIFMWLLNQGYRLVVDWKVGASFLGILGVGFGVAASVAALIESLFSQYYQPRYYKAVSDGDEAQRLQAWTQLYKFSVVAFVPCMFYVAGLSKYLVGILLDPAYLDAWKFVCIGAFIELFRILTNIVYSVSQSEKKTRSAIIPYMVGALIVLIFVFQNNNLTLEFSNYIAIALVGAYLSVFTLMFVLMKRLLPIKVEWKFFGLVGAASAPLLVPSFIFQFAPTFWVSFLICGFFGLGMLGVITLLFKKLLKNLT